MKTTFILFLISFYGTGKSSGQTPAKADQVIEGGKVIVELVKAISGKKDVEKDNGCKGTYADLCIWNESINSMTVYLENRVSSEKREVVILPQGKECSLHARVGVWTYDLRVTGVVQSIRKGDLLIEGCNNLSMTIK
jgi:hypothetical protein